MAWPIQPIVLPIANSINGEPAGSPSTRATEANAKSRLGFSRMSAVAAVTNFMTNRSSADVAYRSRSMSISIAARGSPPAYSGWPNPSRRSPRRSRAAKADRRSRSPRTDRSIASTRAPEPPCFGPASADSPAITTAYGSDPADATHRAVNDDTFSSRSEEHTSELQSQSNLVCRLLLEKKNQTFPDLSYIGIT